MTDEGHQLEIAGQIVTIRPMSHGDADMERDFVRRLSPESPARSPLPSRTTGNTGVSAPGWQ